MAAVFDRPIEEVDFLFDLAALSFVIDECERSLVTLASTFGVAGVAIDLGENNVKFRFGLQAPYGVSQGLDGLCLVSSS